MAELKRLSLADFAHETQARLAAVEAVIGPLKYAEWSGVPDCKDGRMCCIFPVNPELVIDFGAYFFGPGAAMNNWLEAAETIWGQVFDDTGKARPVIPHGEKFGPKRIDREALAHA